MPSWRPWSSTSTCGTLTAGASSRYWLVKGVGAALSIWWMCGSFHPTTHQRLLGAKPGCFSGAKSLLSNSSGKTPKASVGFHRSTYLEFKTCSGLSWRNSLDSAMDKILIAPESRSDLTSFARAARKMSLYFSGRKRNSTCPGDFFAFVR